MTSRACRRAGVALITALVVMAVLSIVLTVVAAQVFAHRNMLRQRERQLQSEWLARAGVEAAAARLLESPGDFTEENRTLLPPGKVRIEVKKDAAGIYAVSAEADFGLPEEKIVIRSAHARFRRTESGGVIRLQAVRETEK